jgi:1-acyl-sn-glycerol-3-phosphate acyltransferase
MSTEGESLIYKILKKVAFVLAKLLYRIKCDGSGNLPEDGPVIICSNHKSYWDPIFIGAVFRRPVFFMAKNELFRVPLLKQLVTALHAFPVNRHNPDRAAINRSLEILKNGRVLGLFPEGTRYREENGFGRSYNGVALIAFHSNAPLLPVAIFGSNRIMPKKAIFPRFPCIKIAVGDPFYLSESNYTAERDKLSRATEQIMNSIKKLYDNLMEKYSN